MPTGRPGQELGIPATKEPRPGSREEHKAAPAAAEALRGPEKTVGAKQASLAV